LLLLLLFVVPPQPQPVFVFASVLVPPEAVLPPVEAFTDTSLTRDAPLLFETRTRFVLMFNTEFEWQHDPPARSDPTAVANGSAGAVANVTFAFARLTMLLSTAALPVEITPPWFALLSVLVVAPWLAEVLFVTLVPPEAVLPPVDAFTVTVLVTVAVFEFVTEMLFALIAVSEFVAANTGIAPSKTTARGSAIPAAKIFFIVIGFIFFTTFYLTGFSPRMMRMRNKIIATTSRT
jgi:hypothetical protein